MELSLDEHTERNGIVATARGRSVVAVHQIVGRHRADLPTVLHSHSVTSVRSSVNHSSSIPGASSPASAAASPIRGSAPDTGPGCAGWCFMLAIRRSRPGCVDTEVIIGPCHGVGDAAMVIASP
jgi:hypothetical protein